MDSSKKEIKVQEVEERFVVFFFKMYQAVRLYQNNSQLLGEYVTGFRKNLEGLLGSEELSFLVSNGLLCVQGETLRYRRDNNRIFNDVVGFFEHRELEGLIFYPTIKEVLPEEVLSFFRILVNAEAHDNPSKWLELEKKSNNFNWINFIPSQDKHRKPIEDVRERVRVAYWQAHASVKEVSEKLTIRNLAGVRKMKRVMQNMVQLTFEDESILLGASTLRDYDDYTFSHSVNVAILALCLGSQIGLSRKSLSFLSICGLLHDLGKVEIPREIINKPSSLSTEEWEEVKKHPVASVKQILMLKASHDLKSKIMLGPFEHHLCFDLSGYPETEFTKEVSLFGRILQIVDVYDAITSPRAYHDESCSPPKALEHLLDGAGKEFDMILTKVFIAMMGAYPTGTLLHLGTGEMALVMDYPQKKGTSMPRVILLEEGEEGIKKGEVVNLEEKSSEKSLLRRKILGFYHPNTYGINSADFLL